MKTFTQFITELKLPKPKDRARTREFVRGTKGQPMDNDPLVGKEMSDSSGYVLGKFPSTHQSLKTNTIPHPPRKSNNPKYKPSGMPTTNSNPLYVGNKLSDKESKNLDSYTSGKIVADRIKTGNMTPKQIRKLKRKLVHKRKQNWVKSHTKKDIIKPPTPRQQAISDKLNKIKKSKVARVAGKIGSVLFPIT